MADTITVPETEKIVYDENKPLDPERYLFIWNVLFNGIVPPGRLPQHRVVEKELIQNKNETNSDILAYHWATRLYWEDVKLEQINGMPALIDHFKEYGVVGVHGGAYLTNSNKDLLQHFNEGNIPDDLEVPGGGYGYKLVTRIATLKDQIPYILEKTNVDAIQECATSISYATILADPGPECPVYYVKRVEFREGSYCKYGRNAGSGVIMEYSKNGHEKHTAPTVDIKYEPMDDLNWNWREWENTQKKPLQEISLKNSSTRSTMEKSEDTTTKTATEPTETKVAHDFSRFITPEVARMYGFDTNNMNIEAIVQKMSQEMNEKAERLKKEEQERVEKAEREAREKEQAIEKEARELVRLSQKSGKRLSEEESETLVDQLKKNGTLREQFKTLQNSKDAEMEESNKKLVELSSKYEEQRSELQQIKELLMQSINNSKKPESVPEKAKKKPVAKSAEVKKKTTVSAKRKVATISNTRVAAAPKASKKNKLFRDEKLHTDRETEAFVSFTQKFSINKNIAPRIQDAIDYTNKKFEISLRNDDLCMMALLSGNSRQKQISYGMKSLGHNLSQRDCLIKTMQYSENGPTADVNRYLKQRQEEAKNGMDQEQD